MKVWNVIKFVLMLIISTILVVTLYALTTYIIDGIENDKINSEIEKIVHADKLAADIRNQIDTQDVDALVKTQHQEIYKQLQEVNDEAVGWISIADTNINYLVVQAEDNAYYLDRNLSDEKSARGSIFMDYRSQKDSLHTIVYGHNMNDGSMFGTLKDYSSEEYFNNHKLIEFHMYGEKMEWEIFSVSYSSNTLLMANFDGEKDYSNYVFKLKRESLYETNVEVNEQDRILTLSTCSDKFYNARLVVHAKLVTNNN